MNKCPCCGSDVTDSPRPIVSLDTNKLLASGEIIRLTPREAELMSVLVSAMPLPVDTERLIGRMYGATPVDDAYDTLKVYVCRLRKKLSPTTLELRTIWGRGLALAYRGAA